MHPLRIAGFQAVVGAIGVLWAFLFLGENTARAAGYGGLVAVANALMLAWRMRAAGQQSGKSPGQELARLVRSSVERFLMVGLLVAAGLGWLKLMPAPMMLGFVLGQVVLVVSTIISGIEKQ